MDRFAVVWLLPLWLSAEKLAVAKELTQAWSDGCKICSSWVAAAAQTDRDQTHPRAGLSVKSVGTDSSRLAPSSGR